MFEAREKMVPLTTYQLLTSISIIVIFYISFPLLESPVLLCNVGILRFDVLNPILVV